MIAFDTNILLYAADLRDPHKQSVAAQTLRSSPDGVLLWQVAAEFIASSRKLSVAYLTADDAWDLLAHYLDTFPLVLPTPNVLRHARLLHANQQWSFWDSMIVGACIEAGVTRLYSEDLPGSKAPSPLEIVNPFA